MNLLLERAPVPDVLHEDGVDLGALIGIEAEHAGHAALDDFGDGDGAAVEKGERLVADDERGGDGAAKRPEDENETTPRMAFQVLFMAKFS